jgi:hypothetical protein
MSFNPAIPVVTDLMAQSQIQCNANFTAINNAFSRNHFPLSENDDKFNGMHNLLLFAEQPGDPTTTAGQVALYTKLISNIPELFFRPQSDATPIQLTYPSIQFLQNPGYTFVAGPFIVYMGFVEGVTSGQTITPTPTSTLLYAGVTVLSDTIDYANAVISGSSFTVNLTSGGPKTIYYFVIGK